MFYPTPHSLEVLKKSAVGLPGGKLDRDTKLPECMTKTQRLDLLTKALSEFVYDEDAQLGKTERTVWDVSLSLRMELTVTGPSLSPARTARPISSPHTSQGHVRLAKEERSSHRLPHDKAGLLDHATR
jgi:hypothetical protein